MRNLSFFILFSALLCLQSAYAQTTITQSADLVSINNGIQCNGFNNPTTQTSNFRRFDLDGAHGIAGPFALDNVRVGTFISDPGITLYINFYTINPGDPLLLANLTQIGIPTSYVTQVSDNGAMFTINTAGAGAVVPPGLDLVVELFIPDGETVIGGYYTAYNTFGETADSYALSATACGITEITTLAAIGLPGYAFMLEVTGNAAPPPAIPTLSQWGLIILGLSLAIVLVLAFSLKSKKVKVA